MKKTRVYLENSNEELELVKEIYGVNLSKAVSMLVKEVCDGTRVKKDARETNEQRDVRVMRDNGFKRKFKKD